METLKNPTVFTIPNPQGVDKAIADVQAKLAALPWMEKAFGRAFNVQVTVDGTKRSEPRVYSGVGEYYAVVSNDALKAYSFWRTRGRRVLDEWEPLQNYGNFFFSDQVDLIVWANLQAVDPTKAYVFTEELIKDVLTVLSGDPNFEGSAIWDDKPDEILSGYTIFPEQRDMLMYPYAAFRIEGTLRYAMKC